MRCVRFLSGPFWAASSPPDALCPVPQRPILGRIVAGLG
jgi:hypothetical protein